MLGAAQRLADGADILFGAVGDHPGHFEIFVRKHGAVLGRQIADMPIGGQDHIVGPQIFIDCRCLCRRFDDDDVHAANFLDLE